MSVERENLGEKSDVEAVSGLIDLRGLRLLDLGCGPGRTARELAAKGAHVLGFEPDPAQAAKNRAAASEPGVTLEEAPAEALPVADSSADGVLFFRSLHHVPRENMARALSEAARALKVGGFVACIEPSVEGSHFKAMRPFHDETEVRRAAQQALDRFAEPLFSQRRRYIYRQTVRYADFAAFVARFAGQTFNDLSRERIDTDEVRALFEAGRTAAGDYAFEQPMWLDLFRAARQFG